MNSRVLFVVPFPTVEVQLHGRSWSNEGQKGILVLSSNSTLILFRARCKLKACSAHIDALAFRARATSPEIPPPLRWKGVFHVYSCSLKRFCWLVVGNSSTKRTWVFIKPGTQNQTINPCYKNSSPFSVECLLNPQLTCYYLNYPLSLPLVKSSTNPIILFSYYEYNSDKERLQRLDVDPNL